MKRSQLYLSLCIAIAANFTTGFKASSTSDEQSKRASDIVKQTKVSTLNSPHVAVISTPPSVVNSDAASDKPSNKTVKLTISGTPKVTSTVYNIYQFRPVVADSLEKPLRFTIKNKPSWLSFDASTGLLQGTPFDSHLGEYNNIAISVSNAADTVDLPPFSITVNPAIDIAFEYGRAKQGTDKGYPFYSAAENIIDRDSNTFNRTRGGANAENWVQVELPHFTRIYKVVIKAKSEFAHELKNADVYLTTKPYLGKLDKGDRIASLKGITKDQTITLKKGKIASYLIIKGKNDTANTKQLALVKVEAYGKPPKSPVFNRQSKHYLLDKSAAIGSQLTKLSATDYQGDKLSYAISENVPFIINTDGTIKVSEPLTKRAYRFNVTVSDGVNQTSTKISVKISTQKNLQQALKTGDETLITEEQIIQAVNKTHKTALKKCITQTNSETALRDCRERN